MSKFRKTLYIVLAVLNGAAVVTFAIAAIVMSSVTGTLDSQYAAERWSKKEKYSQISMFYSQSAGVVKNDIFTMRVDIDKKLTENSIENQNPNARLWIDAYSTPCELLVSSARNDVSIRADVKATATGGDYFIFHPLKLVSGYYYSDDDLMQDRILIDHNLAWQMFGSTDVAGMTVMIGGNRFYVAGVFEPESDSASEYVYGENPRMFISYEALTKLSGGTEAVITAYEVCIPNPIKDFASNILNEVNKTDEERYRLVENSERYSMKNLLAVAFDGGKRAVIDTDIIYPYWENAARITEEKASVPAAVLVLSLVIPIITVLYFVWYVIHTRKKWMRRFAEWIRTGFYNIMDSIKVKKQNSVKS